MRRPDWRLRLSAYLSEVARRPFEAGRHDCALFAAGAVEAMTGENPALPIDYDTIRRGLVALRDAGFDDHIAFVAARFEEVHVSRAQAGDLAVIATAEGPALGVVQGPNVYVAGRTGLGFVELLGAVRAFRV